VSGREDLVREVLKLVPGVLVLAAVGVLSRWIAAGIPHVSHLIVAIVLGMVAAKAIDVPSLLEEGIVRTYGLWLETGIVVLGARVVLSDILQVGPSLLAVVCGYLLFTALLTEGLSRLSGVDRKLGSCLAAGTSVCGVSAIIATGGGIDVEERDLAVATAIVLLFDIVTVLAYPLLAATFGIPDVVYGAWAGLSMFSTGTSVAAGFAVSEVAGQWATVMKMSRNAFIGVWALLYTFYYLKPGTTTDAADGGTIGYLWRRFPKMIVGFVIVSAVASSGMLTDPQITAMKNIYDWLFVMAFVGLGYSITPKNLEDYRLRPLLVVLIVFVLASVGSLAAVSLVFS